MSTVEWVSNDVAFRSELLRGRKTEMRVALDLLDAGLMVQTGCCRFRDSFDDRKDFLQEQDVIVARGHILEVKSRNLAFSGVADYPYDTAFVCATRRWDAREAKPCAVVLISERTEGGRVVVPVKSTRNQWITTSFHDPVRDFQETVYAVAKSALMSWADLLAHLSYPCGEFGAA